MVQTPYTTSPQQRCTTGRARFEGVLPPQHSSAFAPPETRRRRTIVLKYILLKIGISVFLLSCHVRVRYHWWNLLNKTEHASRTFASFLSGCNSNSSCLESVLLSFSKSQSLARSTKSCCDSNPPRPAVFTTSSQSFGSDIPKILQLPEAMSIAMELIHSLSRGEKRTKSEYRAKT